MEIYGEESLTKENFIDVYVQEGNLYKRYYSKISNMPQQEIADLIHKITVEQGFIIDKSSSEKLELVDSKTGTIRYYIWANHTVEKYFVENLGPIAPANSLLN